MFFLDMSNNNPTSRTKDFFASPALSLSLAGVFRNAGAAASSTAGAEEEISGGREVAVDISSENTATGRSEEDVGDEEGLQQEDDHDGDQDNHKNKKRKKYHRHTADQIREMEALFKESPHPDEKQRLQLSKKLGLAPRQVKFWFQNRRTQIKAVQERHENSLLKSELEKLREENRAMRETMNKACCPNCGAATSKDAALTAEEQQLRIENARLKAEVEKLRGTSGKHATKATSPISSCSAAIDQESRSPLDNYNELTGLDRSRILEIVNQAMDELTKMATASEPLWVRSVETGREILNYDEYIREFSPEKSGRAQNSQSIEASRETSIVFVNIPTIVKSFMDVNQWKEMFPCIISKASTVDVIASGETDENGTIQLMFAELQMLTPLVPSREVYFVRYCKQLCPDRWAIVDISIDKVDDKIDSSLTKCRKRPSGCIIEEKSNGHCKVIWVEHLECQRSPVHAIYRSIVNNGLAFGAKHWMATLQHQCERIVFSMATNVPTKDSSGVTTLAGRKSILKLAQRMTWSFCRAVGASSYNTWTKLLTKDGDDLRVSSRKNVNDSGEPFGTIVCAVSSVWLPVSPQILFDFLRDESRRAEWDIMSTGIPLENIASLAKAQDRGNAVTVQATKSKENVMWILQDCCTNAYESMVVYAPVEVAGLQSVMAGCDSSKISILPSGFSILSDGLEMRRTVISTRTEEKSMDGGSMLTTAIQILADTSPTAKLAVESVDTANTLISCTLKKIKASLKCEDG